jgi:hypothetical protein
MRLAVVAALTAAVLCSSTAVGAATTYQGKVNALCRSYTPRLTAAAAKMKQARAAGDIHTSAYYLGVVLGLSLAEGRKIEATPVPAALKSRMARPLHLLHTADTTLNTALERAVAGDAVGFQAAAATLDKLGPGLNASLDAAGLRDCGSGQG